jgi:NAD(P)-dependent dehydrogenase (short-subunit alcohol dehydrogenase family)
MKLRNKVSIVTGGAKGIGRGISLRFAEEGSKVVIAQRDRATGEKCVREIEDAGGTAAFVATDVSVKGQVENLIEETLAHFDRVDVLVNNAAITLCYEPILEMSLESWQRVIDVNLTGVFLCSQAAARHMAERRFGRIINIGSVGSFMPERDCPHYCAAKGGVIMLTRSMALDLAPFNILVNAIAPVAIMTEKVQRTMRQQGVEDHTSSIAKIPLARFGEVEEVAAAAAFLASDDASYMQGTTLVVDGGYLLT